MKLFKKKKEEGEDELNILDGEIVSLAHEKEERAELQDEFSPEEEFPAEFPEPETLSTAVIVEPLEIDDFSAVEDLTKVETEEGEEETEGEEESEPVSPVSPPEGEEAERRVPVVETAVETVPVKTAPVEIPVADPRTVVIPDVPEIHATDAYSPSYLVDGCGEDYAAFLEYLRHTGKSEATRLDYAVVLRRWRKEFEKQRNCQPRMLSPDLLNTIFGDVKASVALKLKYVLSSYADYRSQEGDPRLLYLLSAHKHELNAPTPKDMPEPIRNPTDRLSDEEAVSYEDLGRFLVRKGKRQGIWVYLCLLGVKPSEIQEIGFPNKSNIGFERRRRAVKIKIPRWLYLAMQEIPKWRMGRKLIHRELTALGVSPNTLNEVARRRQEEGRKRKKQEEKDLKKMVERWRRNAPNRK